MLRRCTFAVALLALAAFAPTPAARAADLSLMGSWWDTSDLGEAAGVGVRVSWQFSKATMLDIGAHYFEELTEGTELDDLGDLDFDQIFEEDGLQVIPIEAGVRFGPGGFYAGLGLSYYLLDAPSGVEIDDELGYYGILGWEFGKPRGFRVFVEGKYRVIEGDIGADITDVLDTITVDLGGLSLNVGVTFRL